MHLLRTKFRMVTPLTFSTRKFGVTFGREVTRFKTINTELMLHRKCEAVVRIYEELALMKLVWSIARCTFWRLLVCCGVAKRSGLGRLNVRHLLHLYFRFSGKLRVEQGFLFHRIYNKLQCFNALNIVEIHFSNVGCYGLTSASVKFTDDDIQ